MDQSAIPSSGPTLQQVAARLVSVGLEPQSEYVDLRSLTADVQANGGILSDTHFDRAISLLESTPEAIVRSMVMVMLAQVGPLPPAHRERVRAAIDPYLHSERELDRRSAAHLRQALAAMQE